MTVVTRFAPSPTGTLHIGGARTALFNWLYARHHKGNFFLRIEDTDRERSTEDAKRVILNGLKWLGLDWEGEPIYQSERMTRHAEVARQLLDSKNAYFCYCTPEELAEMRERARAESRPMRYDGRWRDRDPSEAPPNGRPAVRIKAPQAGETEVEDLVQGRVTVANEELDDMILLRADGTPTYMLSVVVDDHDMGITHVIRGDDHLTNAFRQTLIYRALDWEKPHFAHIPLIHGPDGKKLSKRHGAVGLGTFMEAGYLPEALRNYLLRLGWAHGDDEIIDTEQATEWFDLDNVGRSPARFDYAKLDNLNAHYLRETDDLHLLDLIAPRLETLIDEPLTAIARTRIERGMKDLKQRARTLNELAGNAAFYARTPPLPMSEKAAELLTIESRAALAAVREVLTDVDPWDAASLEASVRAFAEVAELKLGQVAQPLRAALTGATVSPGIFEVMAVLGREETVARLSAAAKRSNGAPPADC